MPRSDRMTTAVSIVALCLAAILLTVDRWCRRQWQEIQAEAQPMLDRAFEMQRRSQAELDACLEVVQLQQAWAEVYTAKNDHWLTMSADEKDRVLERERALWAATQRVLTERRGS